MSSVRARVKKRGRLFEKTVLGAEADFASPLYLLEIRIVPQEMRIEEPFEKDVAEQHVIIGTVESGPLSVLNARHSFSQDA